MFYRKNVRGKERIARMAGSGLMILCGLVGLNATPLGLPVACAGVVAILTGMIGYCPACAMPGRKSIDR